MDYDNWMQKARESIQALPLENGAFELKSLFREYDWKALEKGDRISFGRHFANEVREGRVAGIRSVERGKNNHARYIKVD